MVEVDFFTRITIRMLGVSVLGEITEDPVEVGSRFRERIIMAGMIGVIDVFVKRARLSVRSIVVEELVIMQIVIFVDLIKIRIGAPVS